MFLQLASWLDSQLTHAYNGAAVVQSRPLALHGASAGLDHGGQLGIEGVGEADMADEALLEEGEGADALCAVDNLVGDDKVHGLDVLLEGADGAEGDDAAHADVPQGRDVGARGDLMGRELVVGAVPRKEGDGHAVVLEDLDRGRGVAPWRQGVDLGDGHVAIDLGEAGAAYDGDVDRSCGGRISVSGASCGMTH